MHSAAMRTIYLPQPRESSAVWAACRIKSTQRDPLSGLGIYGPRTALVSSRRSASTPSGNLLKTGAFHAIEASLARFTSIGPDVCGEEDIIRQARPRTPDSGGLTV